MPSYASESSAAATASLVGPQLCTASQLLPAGQPMLQVSGPQLFLTCALRAWCTCCTPHPLRLARPAHAWAPAPHPPLTPAPCTSPAHHTISQVPSPAQNTASPQAPPFPPPQPSDFSAAIRAEHLAWSVDAVLGDVSEYGGCA